jgi:hypothetical protein
VTVKSLFFLLLLCGTVGFLGASLHETLRGRSVNAQPTPTWNCGRMFYLTKSLVQGNATLTACAAGYHMASIWEIHEPAILKYNTTLGQTSADSGEGPPTFALQNTPRVLPGWVRTGYSAVNLATADPGTANCVAWTDNSSSNTGSAVYLYEGWNTGLGKFPDNILPWFPYTPNGGSQAGPPCNVQLPVWCVEN